MLSKYVVMLYNMAKAKAAAQVVFVNKMRNEKPLLFECLSFLVFKVIYEKTFTGVGVTNGQSHTTVTFTLDVHKLPYYFSATYFYLPTYHCQ